MSLYAVQWAALPFATSQWVFLLGTSYLAIASLVTGISILCAKQIFLIRSVLVLWSLSAWLDVIKFIIWQGYDKEIDLSVPLALIFALWLIFILRRKVMRKSDLIKPQNITLFVLTPKTNWDIVKSLFGAPAPSICIGAEGKVWSFRKKTGRFEVFTPTESFLASHTAIDTGVGITDRVRNKLNTMVGAPRGAAFKCIWQIRHPLNMLGEKFSIKTWFDYVPSIYLMRIL